jgi:hypothetical protein
MQYIGSNCEGMVAAVSDSGSGNFYAKTTVNVGCDTGTVEIIYVDTSGIERNMRAYVVNRGYCGLLGCVTQLSINRSKYRSILEVSANIDKGSSSRNCDIFYNPTFVTCGAGSPPE